MIIFAIDNTQPIKIGKRYFFKVICSFCGEEKLQESMSYHRGAKPRCCKTKKHKFSCFLCGSEFYAYRHKRSDKIFCSRKCYHLFVQKENNPNWCGGKTELHIDETIRPLINKYLRRNIQYSKRLLDLVGYTPNELRNTISRKFSPGMDWNNRNLWHIDHIIPRSAFNYETEHDLDFRRCWSLNNLQPLWANENLIKHAKLDHHFQPMMKLRRAE